MPSKVCRRLEVAAFWTMFMFQASAEAAQSLRTWSHTGSVVHSDELSMPEAAVPSSYRMDVLDSGVSDANSPRFGIPPPFQAPPTQAGTPLPSSQSADAPSTEGDLRIVDRLDINGFVTGALQVFQDGEFGAVCASSFDPVDADVACRQLGFAVGTALPLAIDRRGALDPPPEEVDAPFVLQDLGCSGTEERLVDCPGSTDDLSSRIRYDYLSDYYVQQAQTCDPERQPFAFVACGTITGPEPGDLRLVNGATADAGNAQYGRLQVFAQGGWGAVCDPRPVPTTTRADPEIDDATVGIACRQLGFFDGVKTQLPLDTTSREERRIPTLLGGLDCTGDENSLLDCPGAVLGEGSVLCSVAEAVSVICFNQLDATMEGSLRLVDGEKTSTFEYGRLEIFLNGFWSNICDVESFTPDSAQVACSILGYDGGTPLNFRQAYIVGSDRESQVIVDDLPVALANVDCDGNETSLLQCSSSQSDIRSCRNFDSNFTDSTVLACCSTDPGCPPAPPPTEGSVRLRGGFGTLCDQVHTGFVEVFHDDEWGAICAGTDPTGRLVGDVVCRQLGFPHGTMVDPSVNPAGADRDIIVRYDYDNNFLLQDAEEAEEPVDRYWLETVSCRGSEDMLLDCELGNGLLDANDDDSECIRFRTTRLTVACRMFPIIAALEAVTTPGAEEGDVRLVDSAITDAGETGRLEIFFEGSWSQICASFFSDVDASVACRQLGFESGTTAPARAPATTVYPEVALSGAECNGTETTLLECGSATAAFPRFEGRFCWNEVSGPLTVNCVPQ